MLAVLLGLVVLVGLGVRFIGPDFQRWAAVGLALLVVALFATLCVVTFRWIRRRDTVAGLYDEAGLSGLREHGSQGNRR